MKKVLEKAKENPWWIFLPLLMGGGGTIAKFGFFDPLLEPLNTIIYQQKIQILITEGMTYDEAIEEARYQMYKNEHWGK